MVYQCISIVVICMADPPWSPHSQLDTHTDTNGDATMSSAAEPVTATARQT
ncbi:MAG: hypothetical protein RML75_08890 [Cyanobacteriota bacterium SKYGB_h_bin112]|nr:hypothetical protein [Cyanobacteriota bacterium SKYGB_h_bin112]